MAPNPIYTNPYRHPEDTGLHAVGREINFGTVGLSTGVFPIGAFEKNTIIEDAKVTIITAFNAATTNVLEIGTLVAGTFTANLITNANAAAGTVGANKQGTGTLLGTPLPADTVIYARYTQTGTAATAGKAVAWLKGFVPRTEDPRVKSAV
jgi:hypothetical protein